MTAPRTRPLAAAVVVAALLCAPAARSQSLYAFEDGRGLVAADCATVGTRTPPPRALCWPAGGALRCVERASALPPEACAPAAAAAPRVQGLVAALGRDLTEGRRTPGGRFATEPACTAGVPEGELLLPEGRLPLEPGAEGFTGLVVTDASTRAVLARLDAVPAAASIDAAPLRGREIAIEGRAGARAFRCRAAVLAAGEAAPLIDAWRRLPTDASDAAALERAAFLRQQEFAWESRGALPRTAR